jgi:predicted ferric reductase
MTLAFVGAFLLVFAWWRGAPPAVGPGATLTDAGRLTGLLAGYVAVLQLLLRARLPVIERSVGTDRINAAHRLLGAYLIAVVLAHATLITAGYSRTSGTSLAVQFGAFLTSYPFVAWAMLAAGILLTVGITSVPIIRRHLRYEVWHGLHTLVYLAIVLAFFHQVTDGEHFVHSPTSRMAWTVMFAGAGAAVLWYRWLRPIRLFARHRLTVESVHRETPGTVSIWLSGRRLDGFPGEPGQFFRWRFLTHQTWHVAHPYSLSAEPDGLRLRITATVSGRHSSLLPELPVGTPVLAEGPCGGLLAKNDWHGPVLLIAGGIGITPIRALFADIPSARLTLIYRSHRAADMPFCSELDHISASRDARVHYLIGSRHEARNSLSPDRLAHLCPDVRRAQVYICGSAGFVGHVLASLSTLRVANSHIHTEAFQL